MGTEELGMVGGGQTPKVDIGLNSTPGVHVAAQIETFGRAQGQGTPKRPVSTRSTEREFGDPNKAFSTETVRFIPSDRDFSAQQGGYQMEESHHREEGGQGGGDDRPAAYGPQLGSMGGNGREQEWGQEQRVSVETEYREDAGVRDEMSGSEASHSEGTEEEEEEEEDDEGDMEDNEVDGEGPGERGSEGVSEHVEGETGGLPLSHSQMGGLDPDQVRQDAAITSRDGGFQRNVLDRERSALKAGVGNTGVSNSPFGIFHSPSSTLPFLNSFSSSPSSAQLGGGHTDTNQAQNGSGMGVGPGSNAASYSLTREGGLSREGSREGFRESTVTESLQEHARITSGPLHEQLQSPADADNYYTNYTTLLNSQINNNNGLKATDSTNDSSGRRRITDSQSSAEPSLRRILSDPLTGTLMEDAMIISCGHSVGSAGLRRVLMTSVCITCGASVRTEVMAPNYALRLAVQAYKREEEMTGNIGIKPAKRRRDPAQESIGHIEQQPVLDTTRAKGVQFPFVVSDRVMIKGNKRTPERFVGREAVITTQCLNGWYLVRTLDSGESVRLQYRSLQKVGGWGGNEPTMAEFAGVNFGTQCVE